MKIQNKASLIESIVPYIEAAVGSYVIYATGNHKLPLENKSKKLVYFVIEGKVNVHRKIDDVLIFCMNAPAVVGLFSLESNEVYHYFESASDVKLIAIEEQTFIEIADKNNLWRKIFSIASEYAMYFFIRDEKFNTKNVYSIIKNNLEIIWELPDEERKNISIFKFILSRSQISRSSLNKVLRDLIEGGYIEIERGRLLKMKTLPGKY